ncbi:MAG: C45 family peptidase [Chitinophagales bacterium]|nr:C45 family peptidase [Chitinophagales bacterium]
MKRAIKILSIILACFALLWLALYIYFQWILEPPIPKVNESAYQKFERKKLAENYYTLGNNFLRQNQYGLWEEYIEGSPFDRGVALGKLNKELLYKQEEAFVDQIQNLIPNKKYLKFLSYFTRFFNRDLSKHFPLENQKEIYGESLYAPHEFNYIGAPFDRMLNYHAAHDIGHALQNFALVGCTSFSSWGNKVEDSTMIVGRNLDFSLGDKFAEDKIVLFVKPDSGYAFSIVTWAGFIGCVSGMNEQGITVTINAAKSDIPTKAKTPIAIVARQILQYAKNIDEAFAIAKQHETFVCETFMIGSAADKKTALIEKSLTKTILFKSDTNFIVCANHYQSDSFKNDKNNIENIQTSTSSYRQQHTLELMDRNNIFSPQTVGNILRNQKGLNEKNIGIGNEKALNQLISHHAVIFKPEQRLMWVSANPYQLGAFVCYDLKKIFSDSTFRKTARLSLPEKTLASDTFLLSKDWQNFLTYKDLKQTFKQAERVNKKLENEREVIQRFLFSNPELWETYAIVGKYFMAIKENDTALAYFEKSLKKDVASKQEEFALKELIKECQNKN